MPAPSFSSLQSEYTTLWAGMVLHADKLAVIDGIAAHRVAGKATYLKVQNVTGVPWFVVALIHQLEGSGDWTTHLHNGDSLSDRTHQVPAGRPIHGKPPFTWYDSAVDALTMRGLQTVRGWTLPRICYELEAYNGWGSRNHAIHTPYLWSYSNWYDHGKYVADHVWGSGAVSKQCGAMPLLKRMMKLDASIAPYIEGKIAPFPPPPDIPAPKPPAPKPAPCITTPAPGSLGAFFKSIFSIFRRK
jgi:lysozyme family protein